MDLFEPPELTEVARIKQEIFQRYKKMTGLEPQPGYDDFLSMLTGPEMRDLSQALLLLAEREELEAQLQPLLEKATIPEDRKELTPINVIRLTRVNSLYRSVGSIEKAMVILRLAHRIIKVDKELKQHGYSH